MLFIQNLNKKQLLYKNITNFTLLLLLNTSKHHALLHNMPIFLMFFLYLIMLCDVCSQFLFYIFFAVLCRNSKVLCFAPTIDISKASTMPSLVAPSLALIVAVWSVVHSTPHAATNQLVCFNRRGWNDHQKGDTDQQQHWAARFHHLEDWGADFCRWTLIHWCFSKETQASTVVKVVAPQVFIFMGPISKGLVSRPEYKQL